MATHKKNKKQKTKHRNFIVLWSQLLLQNCYDKVKFLSYDTVDGRILELSPDIAENV